MEMHMKRFGSMRAEWEMKRGTLLSWPHNLETFPGERLDRVRFVFGKIASALSKSEPVFLLVNDAFAQNAALECISAAGAKMVNIRPIVVRTNDLWIRDYGPIGVIGTSEEPVMLNWGYNAWGGKYPPFDADNAVPAQLAERLGYPAYSPDMILEGGSIDVNGEGALLTTETVLLNPNRNPDLSWEDIEANLTRFLGVDQIIWLKRGLEGDDTDGHIDDIARFVNPSTIFAALPEDKNDVNYPALAENLEILRAARQQNGEPFQIEILPMPECHIEGTTVDGSEFVPASYANFYIANTSVLVPAYDERYDAKVEQLFRRYFPNREVVMIPCADLVWAQGSIHCITQGLIGN